MIESRTAQRAPVFVIWSTLARFRYRRLSPETRFATHVSWRRGGLEHEDVSGWVMDLKPYVAKGIQPDADGVLAYTAFQDRLLQLSKNRVGQNSDAGCMLA